MDKPLTVQLGDRSYPIFIAKDAIGSLGRWLIERDFPCYCAIITNETVGELYLQRVAEFLADSGVRTTVVQIQDGEQFKTLQTVENIIGEMILSGHDRGSGLIALGGGVIGDIVGFVAACYLRGVPFVQIPTTLLAQVDSSVGGKTAVNHTLGKNLIGAFYQPQLVCIDVDTLRTLPEREYAAGLAEVIKYGIIRDLDFFEWVSSNTERLSVREDEALIHAIRRSCQIKADIVELDERESSLRAVLNYGHTLGHAVEKLSGYGRFLHGEAVAIGMVAAARISEQLGMCTLADAERIERLLVSLGLPTQLPDFSLSDYLDVVLRDKKVHRGQLRFITTCGIGNCKIIDIENPRDVLASILPSAKQA